MTNKQKLKNEIELQLLSVMLNDPTSIAVIGGKIKAEDISKENRELYTQIINIGSKDCNILIMELSKLNVKNWTISELMQLASENKQTLESLNHNNIFIQFYDLVFSLKVEEFLKEKTKNIENDYRGLDTLLNLQSDIDTLLKKTNYLEEEKAYSEKIDEIYSEIEKEISSTNVTSYTVKNIPSLNSSSGGLRPSNLVGIAGAYKSGKTTLGLNLILDFAKQNIPCGFFSLELSEIEIDRKLLGMLSKVEYEKLREPKKLDKIDNQKLIQYRKEKKKLPLYISDRPMSELDIKAKAQYWRDRYGIKIICIDYLGYIHSRRRFDNREREMSYYSSFLKSLAKELNIVVIVLAQLNRQGKINPGTEYLAESIALARDCDFLFITYNPKEIGISSNNGTVFNESHFFVKLDTTRHTKHKKQFLLQLNDDGNFIEIATEYDTEYQNQPVKERAKL